MPDYKISECPAIASVSPADLLAIVDDPAGTPVTSKATVAQLLALVWPVGSIFVSVVDTNPATLLGFGTWAEIGAGRVPVGKSGDAEFDTLKETGGAKTHTLTAGEIPSHTHTVTDPGHTHGEQRFPTTTGGSSGFTADTSMSGTPTAVTQTTASATTGITNQNTGGGGAHNNVQPYFVCRFWERTA